MCGIAISIDEAVIRISVTDTDLNVATGVTLMLVVIIIYMLSRWPQGLINIIMGCYFQGGVTIQRLWYTSLQKLPNSLQS